MRHTLVELAPDWWRWTYSRGQYFGSGASETRREAIKHLLEERRSAKAFCIEYDKWMADLKSKGTYKRRWTRKESGAI